MSRGCWLVTSAIKKPRKVSASLSVAAAFGWANSSLLELKAPPGYGLRQNTLRWGESLTINLKTVDTPVLTMFHIIFFSRPSPKAGRELQTVSNTRMMKNDGGGGGPFASQSRAPGCECTQRLCTCFFSNAFSAPRMTIKRNGEEKQFLSRLLLSPHDTNFWI